VREGVSGDVLTARRDIARMRGATAIRNNPYRRPGLALSIVRLATKLLLLLPECSRIEDASKARETRTGKAIATKTMIFMDRSPLGGTVSACPMQAEQQ